jgi:stress response protein YsnF
MTNFGKCYPDGKKRWGNIHKDYLDDKRFIQLGEQDAENEDKNSGRARVRINKMIQFVKQVTNEMRQTNIGIKVVPVDSGADVKRAKVRQGVIRGIERQCNAPFSYQYAGEEQVTGGLGAFRIYTKYISDKSFDQTVALMRILDASTVYYGPATEPDVSDAEWCIVRGNGKEIHNGEAGYDFIKSKPENSSTWGTPENPNEFEFWCLEKTKDKLYQFTNGKSVFASKIKSDANPELFVQKNGKRLERETVRRQWYCYKIKAGDVVECTEWPGKWCPIVLVLGREVWVDGERRLLSLCRYSKDAQRMYNYARSASAERLGMAPKAPWVAAIESIPEKFLSAWQNVHRKAVGLLPYRAYDDQNRPLPPPVHPQPLGVDPALTQETLTASDELKATTGIHDASLGQRGNETSGVAIRARQREGDVSTYDFQDNLTIAVRHAGRIVNDLVPKVIDTKRQVRMVGEDEQETVIMVNADSDEAERLYGAKDAYYLSEEEEYDIAVEVGASYATKRMENSENILELMRVSPIAAQALPNKYVRSLDFDDAEAAAEQIERLMEKTTPGVVEKKEGQEPPMPPQAIQAIQQAEQLQAALSEVTQKLQSLETDKSIESAKLRIEDAKLRLEAEKLEIMRYDSQTKRMDVTQKIDTAGIKASADVMKERISAEASLATAAISAEKQGSHGTPEPRNNDME